MRDIFKVCEQIEPLLPKEYRDSFLSLTSDLIYIPPESRIGWLRLNSYVNDTLFHGSDYLPFPWQIKVASLLTDKPESEIIEHIVKRFGVQIKDYQ